MNIQNKMVGAPFCKQLTACLLIALTVFNSMFAAYAQAANLVSTNVITSELANNYEFELANAEKPFIYQKASYISSSGTVSNQTLESFHAKIIQNKIALPPTQWLPIAGDITVFIPHYPIGKIIGDGFVQNRYVRSQIYNLLGRHLIDTARWADEAAQADGLYNFAFEFAKNSGLKFGTPLMANTDIPNDMIWPEYRQINGQKVLVPIVYLTANTISNRRVSGHSIELGNYSSLNSLQAIGVSLKTRQQAMIKTMADLTLNNANITSVGDLSLIVRGTLNNINSSISAADLLNISALQLINNGGTISAGDTLTIDKTGIVQNVSGTIQANGNIRIIAGEIISKPVVYQFKDKNGSGTRLGTVASINSQNGNIELETLKNGYANGDITIQGATVSATNGAITFNAANNINISAISTQYQTTYQQGDWQVNEATMDVLQSRLTAKETIKLIAGGSIEINASELHSTQGGIELLAELGVYVLNDYNQTQISKTDNKGKTTGNMSALKTVAVRSVLDAGKGVLVQSGGDEVILRGVELKSKEGATIDAKGKVRLLMAKEQDHYSYNSVKKGTFKIKTLNEGHDIERGQYNIVTGGLQINALYGVEVEVGGDPNKSLDTRINELVQTGGTQLSWLQTLRQNDCAATRTDWATLNDAQKNAIATQGKCVDWQAVDLVVKQWRESKSTLSPAAMAIIAIACAVATGGSSLALTSGSSLIGGLSGASALMANAAFTTLVTQAATGLASGQGVSGTLKSMGSKDSIRQLAISMVTAGALSKVSDYELFKSVENAKDFDLLDQSQYILAKSTVEAGISTALSGQKLSAWDNIFSDQFKVAIKSNAINAIGTAATNKIAGATSLTEGSKYIAHAAIGCISGALSTTTEPGVSCASGAGGAVIGYGISQAQADQLETKIANWVIANKNNPEAQTGKALNTQINEFVSAGADLSKLIAGLAAFAAGGDVNSAASTSTTAFNSERNYLYNLARNAGSQAQRGLLGCGTADPSSCSAQNAKKLARTQLINSGKSSAEADALLQKYAGVFSAIEKFNKYGLKGELASPPAVNYVNGEYVLADRKEFTPGQEAVFDMFQAFKTAKQAVDTEMTKVLTILLDNPIGEALGSTLKIVAVKANEVARNVEMVQSINNGIREGRASLAAAGFYYIAGDNSTDPTSANFNQYGELKQRYLDYQEGKVGSDSVLDIGEGINEYINQMAAAPAAMLPPTNVFRIVPPGTRSLFVTAFKDLDELYQSLKISPRMEKIEVGLSHWKPGSIYNDGKLGETLMQDVLEKLTGKRFTAIQNTSGHGPDGIAIDHTKTPVEIYVAEAKSSVNGANAAERPSGDPNARLSGWVDKYLTGKFDTASPEGRAMFDQIINTCGVDLIRCNVRGIWAQVEVPRPGATKVSLDATLKAW